MTPELIISLISLGLSTACSILTILVNIKISKINSIEARHKYEKQITYFELQYKDEAWFYTLLNNDGFRDYDLKSRKKIFRWWKKYTKKYPPKLLDSKLPEIGPNIVMFKSPLPIENFEGLDTSEYTKKELENLISETQKEELEEYK